MHMVRAMKNVIELEVVASTNSYAKANIETLSDKTVILAHRQTAGRGRLNRSWIDLGHDNLFMTLVLKPSETFNEIYPNLTQYLSVCLAKVLETYGVEPKIKWPNDVIVNGGKIAGILSETVMQGNVFKGIALGTGVNLNASKQAAEAVEGRVATALNLEINKPVEKQEFLNKLLDVFFENYEKFLEEGFTFIKNDYIKRNCFLNKKLKVQVFNRTEEGTAKEINDKGELVLLNNKNEEVVLTIGDIL